MGAPCDPLADAPPEKSLEQAGLAYADDDQVGVLLLGELDDLVGRPAGHSSELDCQGGALEERVNAFSMLVPEHLVGSQVRPLGLVGVIRHECERTGHWYG